MDETKQMKWVTIVTGGVSAIIVPLLVWWLGDKSVEKVRQIEVSVKESSENRAERESNHSFDLKLYDLTIGAINNKDNPARMQNAARVFIGAVATGDVKKGLLSVLESEGVPEVKRAAIQDIFNNESKELVTVRKTVEPVSTQKQWSNWDFDLFWCETSGNSAESQANELRNRLVSENAQGRIRVRMLPREINQKEGYGLKGYIIRQDSDAEEKKVASMLKATADPLLGERGSFELQNSQQGTKWYISAFYCPQITP